MNDFTTSEARVRRVKELTDGRGADIVVEVVGIAAAAASRPIVVLSSQQASPAEAPGST